MATPLISRASSWKWAGLPASIAFGASIHAFASELLASAEVVYRLSSGREDVELSRVAFSVVSVRVVPPLGFWLFALAVAFSHRFDGRRGVRAARVALCALGVPWAVIVFATAGLFVAGPWTMRSVAVFGPAVVIVLVSTALFGLVALAVPHERVRESDTWEVVSARLSYVLLACFALQMVSGIVYGHGSEVVRLAVRLFWLASFGLAAYVVFACVVRLLRSRSSAELRIVLVVVYVGVFAVATGMPVPKFGALLCLAALILREVTRRVAPSGHSPVSVGASSTSTRAASTPGRTRAGGPPG